MSIGIVVGLYSIASFASSRLAGQKLRSNFANFSYSYLAAFFIYALIGSIFGQIAINGGLYLAGGLHYLGIYMYTPQTLLDVASSEPYTLKWIPEALAAILVGGYVAYRIARNMTGNNVRKMILAAGPHILMVIFFVLIFTTISPRWS
jgi:hypothetical protein